MVRGKGQEILRNLAIRLPQPKSAKKYTTVDKVTKVNLNKLTLH
jgi:hypothetical protein